MNQINVEGTVTGRFSSAMPVTSSEANKMVARTSSYDSILEHLRVAGDVGSTAPGIEAITGIKAHKRLPELRKLGKVKLKTQRLYPGELFPAAMTRKINGRPARVWVLA